MNEQLLRKILRQATKDEIKEAVKIMRHYTSTWEHKPTWNIKSKRVSGGYSTQMTSKSRELIYTELGTRKRYRRMSSNPRFAPKTTPGSLTPSQGRGYAQGWYRIPKPGLKPRDNIGTMAKLRGPVFVAETQAKINRAAKQLFAD